MPGCLQACTFVQDPFAIIPCTLSNSPFENPFRCPHFPSHLLPGPWSQFIPCSLTRLYTLCLVKHPSPRTSLFEHTEWSSIKEIFYSQSFMDILRGSGQCDCDLKECHTTGFHSRGNRIRGLTMFHCLLGSGRCWGSVTPVNVFLALCGTVSIFVFCSIRL